MKIVSYTFHYQPDIDDDYTYPAAIMATDTTTGEILCVTLTEDHPAAPIGHDEYVVDEFNDLFDALKIWRETEDDALSPGCVECGIDTSDGFGSIVGFPNPDVEADDLDTGVLALLDTHVLRPLGFRQVLYQTFTVDYRPNADEHYPLAIFTYDESIGRFTAQSIADPNPFLPPLSRQQRRAIRREMEKFYKKLTRGDVQAALDGLDRPRFGVFKIDDYDAVTPDEAMHRGLADLSEYRLSA